MDAEIKKPARKPRKAANETEEANNNLSESSSGLSASKVTSTSSDEPNVQLSSLSPPDNIEKATKRKKKVQSGENFQNSTRTLRKCRYAGTYSAKQWDKPPQMKKNVKLRDRLAELEKMINQNKDTGISLDYNENEAKIFFGALGIQRINPSGGV